MSFPSAVGWCRCALQEALLSFAKGPIQNEMECNKVLFLFRKVFKNPILQKEIIHEEYKGPTPRMPPFSSGNKAFLYKALLRDHGG